MTTAATPEPGPGPDVESTWRPGRAVDVTAVLGPLVRGSGDPTHRPTSGGLWRTCRTPHGPAALHLHASAEGVHARAWGLGAEWAVDGVPALLGERDRTADDFAPSHPFLREALRRRSGWRVPRTGLVLEALVPAIIEQKVTGQEAFGGWRRLLHRFGEPAPGPAGPAGLRVFPTPAQWAAIPSWEWLRAGVDGARSAAVVRAARAAGRLEQTLDLSAAEAERRMCSLPGVGVWTAAQTRQRAHGDADAFSFGDFHVPRLVSLALFGVRLDDDALAERLEEFRPHRYRVERMVELEAPRQARRTPRPTPRFHVPITR